MKRITSEQMQEYINKYLEGEEIPKGRFICKENDRYVEMDNTTGDCFVSDWPNMEQGFLRCIGYIDEEGAPFDYREFCFDFMKLVGHINSFEGDSAKEVYKSMGLPVELADY